MPTAEEAFGGIDAERFGVEDPLAENLIQSAERYAAVEKLMADRGFPVSVAPAG